MCHDDSIMMSKKANNISGQQQAEPMPASLVPLIARLMLSSLPRVFSLPSFPRALTSRSAESSKEDLRSKDGHTYTKHVSVSEGFQRGSECRIANGKEGVAGGGGGDWNEEGRSETDRAM